MYNSYSCDTCVTPSHCYKSTMTLREKNWNHTVVSRYCGNRGNEATCKAATSQSEDGCKTFKVENPNGEGTMETKICCCEGYKCNGADFKSGSVVMTLIVALVSSSKFI